MPSIFAPIFTRHSATAAQLQDSLGVYDLGRTHATGCALPQPFAEKSLRDVKNHRLDSFNVPPDIGAMTKLNISPKAVAKRKTLAAALKTNLAKRKALAKQRTAASLDVEKAPEKDKSRADTD